MGIFDRGRPYGGQPHMFTGERGAYYVNPPTGEDPVKPLTVRDIYDAVLIGMCHAYGVDPESLKGSNDLYDRLDFNGSSFDPVAAAQNACAEVEQRLGIYPNINTRTDED